MPWPELLTLGGGGARRQGELERRGEALPADGGATREGALAAAGDGALGGGARGREGGRVRAGGGVAWRRSGGAGAASEGGRARLLGLAALAGEGSRACGCVCGLCGVGLTVWVGWARLGRLAWLATQRFFFFLYFRNCFVTIKTNRFRH